SPPSAAVGGLASDALEFAGGQHPLDVGLAAGWTCGAGAHRLVFETGDYFAARAVDAFYPRVSIDFTVADPGEHHHVPLLLSPFAYSTYRGS
ncbi:hydroxyisourate hydrolase, partial [Streptosporangium sp. NPDC001682]